jgi:glycosyltransferase involved in cell wall biosynthesis
LDQTYRDFEIVVMNDGSTDNTVNEIKKFNDSRIKLFCHELNQGPAITINRCCNEAQGEYIAILNSDDLFLPDKLEKQIRYLDRHPETGAVFSYVRIINDDGRDIRDRNHPWCDLFNQPNRTRFEWLNYFFYHGNCLCHSSILARRDCYTTIAPPDPRFSQLGDFNRWVKICLHYEIHIITEKLVKFRVRHGNANESIDKLEHRIGSAWEVGQILKIIYESPIAVIFKKYFRVS